MDRNLTAFEEVLGGCERIYNSPIPLSYTRLTSRFLIVYLFALPFCLVPSVSLIIKGTGGFMSTVPAMP